MDFTTCAIAALGVCAMTGLFIFCREIAREIKNYKEIINSEDK